ncbi:MAG: hypothetical protein AAF645_20455, partial [Myxococcota bacterium]
APSDTIIVPGDVFVDVVAPLLAILAGESGPGVDRIVESFDSLSHMAIINFDSPYFLGDPKTVGLEDVFNVDSQTGEMDVGRETITMMLFVPKETATAQQPFDTAFYVHGYGSASIEPLPFLGYMMQNGVAVALLNAEGHGAPVDDTLLNLVTPGFRGSCMGPAIGAVASGRAEDLTGDGLPDSGSDFWTAYVFHTRDVVRQSVVDYVRAIQLLASFNGQPALAARFPDSPIVPISDVDEPNGSAYDADLFAYDGPDIAGDFDGDGVPDLGGTDQDVFFTGGSLGGIVSGIVAGLEPEVRASAPIVGAGGLTDVTARSTNGGVLRAMHLRVMGPMVITTPANERNERDTSCADGQVSMYFLATERNSAAQLEFACIEPEVAGPDDVLVVRNLVNGEVRCASVTGGEMGRYRVPFPTDAGDPLVVAIYPGRASGVNYETCEFENPDTSDVIVIDTFQVGAEDCENCATYLNTEWARGEGLVSPTIGYGHLRQSDNLRRLISLAQVALEPADPINYARRVFLEPVGPPTNLFVINSIGDSNVPVAAGNAYARAAGLLPFLPATAPEHLADWRAPADFLARYGVNSPNDVLIQNYVLEGVDRLNRIPHPEAGGPGDFLMDVDDLSEGNFRFEEDGRSQSVEENGLTHPRLADPLRWVRQSRSVSDARGGEGEVWEPIVGEDISGIINHYAVPEGAHGFDKIIYSPDEPWNPAEYLINLVARYGATGGQDIRFITDPEGHVCLEDSSCSFLQPDPE